MCCSEFIMCRQTLLFFISEFCNGNKKARLFNEYGLKLTLPATLEEVSLGQTIAFELAGVSRIDNFTVVCSVTWPLNGSEAGGDLVLIQASLLLSCKSSCSHAN